MGDRTLKNANLNWPAPCRKTLDPACRALRNLKRNWAGYIRRKAAMSDVPEGYKMSKVGVIPDGYKLIKMGALPVDWEKLEAQICVF